MTLLHNLILALAGFAGGLAVGAGYVAFITVLGIIPRLMQMTKTWKKIRSYEWAVIGGVMAGTLVSFVPVTLGLTSLLLIPVGLLSGIFIGLLAAALTEVLNVFPILAKRIGMHEHIIALMMAIALGKIAGSLFHWLYFVYQQRV
ncbi:stage V sporulation protein AB [Bacillus sp. FJAT-27231]|uniref:stage V sporulation protein AB n=1 Tax=Bacillus sp. FJAT-27231 TaxID=1679168 RepID=UPI000670B630|nr:stage V sporulation protein AB [Bacillus sp. FJAT-27231]KMY54663.1 stage V sporulation protein AB [Bacillus sp. FJAT-27231]